MKPIYGAPYFKASFFGFIEEPESMRKPGYVLLMPRNKWHEFFLPSV